jgi:hypothetical protein
MTRRGRIWAWGSVAILVLAGVLCAALVNGVTGEVLTIVLLSLGLGGAMLLVFYEVGLSEDRERARSSASAQEGGPRTRPLGRPRRRREH